jgi:hypothetical protein
MTLQTIEQWINNPGRDYETGLAIYNAYKIDNNFDNFFQSNLNPPAGSMQFNMLYNKVCEIARKIRLKPSLAKQQPIIVKPIDIDELKRNKLAGIQPAGRARIADNPLIEVSKLPEDLQALYYENKNLTKEIHQLHEELKAIPKGNEYNNARKQKALELTGKEEKRADNWARLDTWYRKNILTTPEQKAEFDAKKDELKVSLKEAKKMLQNIENLKINISRTKKAVAEKPALAEKLNPKIEAWQKELDQLEEKLK